MNPLTQVKNIQKATARETAAGISEQGSWHERFKDSAYVNIGLLPFDLTEGDLLAIFAQYGEVVDVNLVRDKATGKSRGFAFLAYEDQRSTVLAVDNLNGAQVVGRTIRVDHVANYKKKIEEDEEEQQRKREERGVCYAFQRGECNRGDACKFSHDLQRNANTGWGKKDDAPAWGRQRNGRSPPPPPWKQGNGLKDDLPPWKRSSGSKDDPPPSRKENGSSSNPQTRDDDRQKGSQLPRRYDDRARNDGPTSSSRQRSSQIDDIPVRGRDNHESARPSRRYDDIEDGHRVPPKRDNDLESRRDRSHRDVSPDVRRSGMRRGDTDPRQRRDSRSDNDSSPKRRSGTRRSDRDESPQVPNRNIDDDTSAYRNGHRRGFSSHQISDRHSNADHSSPKRRRYHSKDNDQTPNMETGTKRRRDYE